MVELKDMTPEQREVAFEKWMNTDSDKKIKNKANRGAITLLKAANKSQYDKFVVDETKRLQKAAA